MESRNRYDGIDSYAVTKIRFHARQLARTRAFRSTDVEDLEQELMLDLLRGLPAFDPTRAGRNTFIARIVENHAASLIKAALAKKRGAAIEHESLQAPIHDDAGGPIELGATISCDDALWDAPELSWDEAITLRNDVACAIGGLPAHLVLLCDRLAIDTVTEVANATGTSRPSHLRRGREGPRRLGEGRHRTAPLSLPTIPRAARYVSIRGRTAGPSREYKTPREIARRLRSLGRARPGGRRTTR